jgi:undecaprenyl-diphosphatase
MEFERSTKYFLAGFVAIAVFFLIMGFVQSGSIQNLDYSVRAALVDLHAPFLNYFFLFVTNCFNNIALIFLFIMAFTLLGRKDLWKDGFFLGATLVGAYALGLAFKFLVARDRPVVSMLHEEGFSFPSGHALKVTLFVLLFVFLYTESIPSFIGRKLLIIFGGLTIFLVCYSRLYFGVHWFSDVLGGFLLGLGIFFFAAWYKIKYEKLF